MAILDNPPIGILTVHRMGEKLPFAGQSKYLQDILREGNLFPAVFFVFTPEDVDFSRGLTHGHILRGRRFVQRTFPLPRVVYDRVPNRRMADSAAIKKLRQNFQERGIPMVSAQFGAKGDLDRLLRRDPVLVPHLPDTVPLHKAEDLYAMLARHRFLYIKPENSSRGAGIRQIEKLPAGYRLRSSGSLGPGDMFTSRERLWQTVKSLGKGQRLIIQQGIPLCQHNGRPFDIRILFAKDGRGQWALGGQAAKVGKPGAIVTNVGAGATPYPLAPVLREIFGGEAGGLLDTLRQLAEKVARVVEKEMGAGLAEVGLDFALDKNGKIWILEVNTKPMRMHYLVGGKRHNVPECIRLPLAYCLFLASQRTPEK